MSGLFAASSRVAQTARDLAIRAALRKRSTHTRRGENNSSMRVQSSRVRSFAFAQDDGTL